MKVTVKWIINDVHSEEYQTILPVAEADPDHKWFEIGIQQFGEKPIPVSPGDRIHCLLKPTDNVRYIVYYGYDGYHQYYSKFDYQDYDFDVEHSTHNSGTSNGDYGMIPFIMYSK